MKLLHIHEQLIGVKQYHKLNWEELKSMLLTKGIRFISSGCFGEVFDSPKWDYVVKVFENDDAYLSFVDYVLKHPSPCFPKFKKQVLKIHQFHTRPSNAPKFLYAVRIEKLDKIDINNVPNDLYELLNWDIIKLFYACKYSEDTIIGELSLLQLFNKYEKFELRALIETLVEFYSINTNFGIDLHIDNLMLRGTKLVCIDPLIDNRHMMDNSNQDTFGLFRSKCSNQSDVDISGPIYDALI